MAALDLQNLAHIDAARYLSLRASLLSGRTLIEAGGAYESRAIYDEQP